MTSGKKKKKRTNLHFQKDHPGSNGEKELKEDMNDCWEFIKQPKKDMDRYKNKTITAAKKIKYFK